MDENALLNEKPDILGSFKPYSAMNFIFAEYILELRPFSLGKPLFFFQTKLIYFSNI